VLFRSNAGTPSGSSGGSSGGGRNASGGLGHQSGTQRPRNSSNNQQQQHLRVSVPNNGAILGGQLSGDQLRGPFNTPTVTLTTPNLGGYQSALSSGFPTDFQLPADLTALGNSFSSAGLLGSWSGHNALGINVNGLRVPDMNLAGTAGLSANGNGTDLNGLLGSIGGHNHQQTVKSEPVSPRNRLEDHIRSQSTMGVTIAGGYSSTSSAGGGVELDVNGHGIFAATAGAGPNADEHGPSASKRARAETAPPPSASATVWSQA